MVTEPTYNPIHPAWLYEEGLAALQRVQSASDDWWHQPAFEAVPFATHEVGAEVLDPGLKKATRLFTSDFFTIKV